MCVVVVVTVGVEGSQDNLEAQRVRNVENREDVEGVSLQNYYGCYF